MMTEERGWLIDVPAGLRVLPPVLRCFASPEVARRMALEGTDIVANSAQEFTAGVAAEYAKWREFVKKTGMKSQ